jgi:tetratricopeptide (TPR) repeat protein
MPLEETGYRSLMELQIETGDRAAAMSTYHRCAALFERELGVGPDLETTAIFDRLLNRRAPIDPHVVASSTPARKGGFSGAAFVGRVRELDALVKLWRDADAGERTAALVYGEPGVGKSRLVAELADFASSEGAVVATSRCFGQSGRLALAPVADWLGCPEVVVDFATLDPVWRVEVDRLVPRVPVRGATAPAASSSRADGVPQPVVDSWARLRFFEGLARAVLHTQRPTLLVLDDLQWCDEETVAWLSFLLEFARDARLMVAATARPGALGDNLGVTAAIRVLKSSGLVEEVDLSPLDAVDAAALAAQLVDRPLSTSDEELLHAATGGYPLFIVEAVQSQPIGGLAAGSELSTDVQGVLRRRLEETSTEAQDVARLAAAVGRDFSLDLLLEASDLSTDALVDAVDELWRCRIFVEHRGGYDFSHDLLRDAAYSAVSSARRWLLHRRLAQGLELLHSGHVDSVAAQLADQYRRGGRPDRALPYYRRAADVAAAIYANAEAIGQHERCLELIGELPEGRDRDAQELEVLQAMSAPLNAMQGYASPVLQSMLERSVSLAERLGRPDVLVRNLVGLFSVRFVQGYTAESHELASRALALSSGDPELAGEAHFAFAGSASSLGLLQLAVEHFDLAIEMSPDRVPLVVGTRPEVHSMAWSAHAMWLLGNDTEAAARSFDAVQRGRLAREPYSLAVALAYASITDQLRGDAESLRRDIAELRSLCRRHEFAYYTEWGLILDGWASGDERGLSRIRLGIRSLRSQGAYARMPYWLSLLADALVTSGKDEEARAVLDAALVGAEQRDDRWWLPDVLRQRAALETGTRAESFLVRGLAVAASQSSAALARRCEVELAAHRVRGSLSGANASRTPSP